MSPVTNRRAFLAASGVGLATLTGLAGCLGSQNGGSGSGGQPGEDEPTSTTASETDTETAADSDADTGALPTAPSQLPVEWTFARLRDRTLSGGPPKDGIPSVDEPQFVSAESGDEFLAPGDIVFGVVRGDDVKAYPQRILVWHEIVNDVLDGDPVSVTYCPLTGTALGFERGKTEFGVSGRLVNSNLVMYDRATDSRWPQVLATAMSGPFQGTSLQEFPVTWTTWGMWKEAHPDTVMLSEETGHVRNYSRDPYGEYNPSRGYYSNPNTLFAPLSRDDRFQEKEVFIGARPPEGAIAFHKSTLRESGILGGEVDGTAYLAVYDPTLDTAHVYRGAADEFSYADGQVTTAAGESFAPDALSLDRVIDFDAMWFAWAGFYPKTVVVA